MDLVIVESPAKAKTINKYLGRGYKVLASFGHVVDLPSRNGSVRPEEDFAMDYEVSPDSKKHLKTIADAVKEADTIYLASDPDREGEAIAWHVVEELKRSRKLGKTAVKRISFNEITKRAVKDALAQPRDIDMDLVNAQQARRALDYLVGFTLSPVLWRKLPGSRSAGRVQSVALRLICEREAEIEAFQSREYWHIDVDLLPEEKKIFTAKLTHLDGEKLDQFAITNEKQAKEIATLLEQKNYSVASVEKKQVRRNPQPPFTTSSMQQEASRKLGFGAKKTMMLAQRLYEGIDIAGETIGLITYMRTDGVTMAGEAVQATRSLIGKQYGDNYVANFIREYKTKAKNAQEAHEAIRATDVTRTPEAMAKYLEEDQLKLYTLIWKRMVASQMASALLDQVIVDVKSTDNYAGLRAVGSTLAFDGFYTLYREGQDDATESDEGKILPPLSEGETLTQQQVTPAQHFTQPPPRFTEASLVKRLEELGIGRPSTYASILSVLQDRNYVKLEKKRFIPESRGRVVTAFLVEFFKRYVEYDFTARLEQELDHISAGEINWKEVLRQFWTNFIQNIEDVKSIETGEVIEAVGNLLEAYLFPVTEDNPQPRQCPSCDDGSLSLKLGKFGGFIACSNYPDCKYTKQLDSDVDQEGAAGASDEPIMLGVDEASKLDVILKKGPFGFYVQLGDDSQITEGKPKRAGLPKGVDPESVSLEQALGLLSLPREVGTHPESGKVIKAGIGRFGPYILHDGKYVSLKEDDVLTIGINRAVTLIAQAGKKKGAEPIRTVGQHPETKEDIALYDGRYGPYIKFAKKNISLPKGVEADSITLEQAVELIAKKMAAPAKKKKAKSKTKK